MENRTERSGSASYLELCRGLSVDFHEEQSLLDILFACYKLHIDERIVVRVRDILLLFARI